MAESIWKITGSQFLQHRAATTSACVILFLIVTALLADPLSAITGLDPNKQNLSSRYLPPWSRSEIAADTKENLIDTWTVTHPESSKILIQALQLPNANDQVLFELGARSQQEIYSTLSKLDGKSDPAINLARVEFLSLIQKWNHLHYFGTDEVGRDVFIRTIYGARVSMGVGVMVAVASALIGLIIGSLAGFYGGFTDSVLMRVTDSLLALPLLPVLILISAIDLTKLPYVQNLMPAEHESIIKLFVILCLFSWMPVARLVRSYILSLKEREFILAAQALGAKDSTLILRHLFPNTVAPLLVAITLGVGESILYEAALSFLGLGIMPPTPSWGNMLTNAQEMIYKSPSLTIIPGLMIFLTTACFNFVGDGLQNAMDPRTIER